MGFLDFIKSKKENKLKTADPKLERKTFFKIDLRPRLISIPSFKDSREVDVRYPLISPYAFAHIRWDNDAEELIYNLEEPPLNKLEREVLSLTEMGLQEMINVSYTGQNQAEEIIDYLERNVQSIIIELGVKISKKSYLKIMYYIYRNFIGLNKIEAILHDYYRGYRVQRR